MIASPRLDDRGAYPGCSTPQCNLGLHSAKSFSFICCQSVISPSEVDMTSWQSRAGLPRRWFVAAAAVSFIVFAAELYFSVRLESQTFDEPAHLYAGYGYWLHSDFGINPEHPPFVKLVASAAAARDKAQIPPDPEHQLSCRLGVRRGCPADERTRRGRMQISPMPVPR